MSETDADTAVHHTYSIADIACFAWIVTHKTQSLTLDDYPALMDRIAQLRAHPAVQRGIAAGGGAEAMRSSPRPTFTATAAQPETRP